MSPDALLTVRYVADHLSVTPRTIHKYIAAGVLDVVRVNARVLRIPAWSYGKLRKDEESRRAPSCSG
jgi:predicted site-specific integrase-resolvase